MIKIEGTVRTHTPNACHYKKHENLAYLM